jgi:V/A-type H+/Na+-transporting ATPase subunit I
MIVKMLKVYVVSRRSDSDRLLESLRDLGVVHLTPVDPGKAVAEEQTLAAIDTLGRAAQILSAVDPAGETPDLAPQEAATEVLNIHRRSLDARSRLTALHRQVEQIALWGDATLEQFAQLREAGIDVQVLSVPDDAVASLQAELVAPVADLPGKRAIVAIVDRTGEFELPENAEPVELPQRDRPSLLAEAAEIDAALQADRDRLAALTGLAGAMESEQADLRETAVYTVATRSALDHDALFALQGWAPVDRADSLHDDLAAAGIDAAVESAEPSEDDEPPTLIHYPKWVQPIQGLFDILGTLPGYNELDLAPFFMIALPFFAAMLIGDAGYGLLFLVLPLVFRKKLIAAAGPQKTNLLMVIGVMTLIWGILTANYFGITPESFAEAGGYYTEPEKGRLVYDFDAMSQGTDASASVGNLIRAAGVLWVPEPASNPQYASLDKNELKKIWNGRDVIIALSFLIGSLHLVLAHLRRLVAYLPDQRAIAEAGWCVVLAAMLGLIWLLFFGGKGTWQALMPPNVMLILLGVGTAMVVLFGAPARNPAKRVAVGIASALLPMLGAFSDTMSYIRLMAVGLASYYIADAFNGLGAQLAATITWYSVLPILIIVFGHLLNIGLAIIAIFAHGVRLNMLEFSSNVGVQWAGYAYEPFASTQMKES